MLFIAWLTVADRQNPLCSARRGHEHVCLGRVRANPNLLIRTHRPMARSGTIRVQLSCRWRCREARLSSSLSSIVTDGMGLNITLLSHRDAIDFGVVSTPEMMPDIWNLIEYLSEELDELHAVD